MNYININKDNYNSINSNNIILVFFAESGAMGDGGSVKIICYEKEKYIFYKTNYTYRVGVTEKITSLSNILREEEKIYNLIPILKKLYLNHTFIRTSGWFEDWWMIDLQYGNHLLIKDEKILIELTEKFKDKSVIEIYQNWKQVVFDYIAKQI